MDSNLPFLSSLLTKLQRQPSDVAAEPQAGVIPYARVLDQVSYLLITSRGTGKWIFPKGAVPSGADPRHIAEAEAREEAGIIGLVEDHWLGSYRDTKKRENGEKIPIEVTLFPMRVEEQLTNWAEERQRHRHWVTFPELGTLITNKEILELVTHLNEVLGMSHG